jgi:hypothetical protein
MKTYAFKDLSARVLAEVATIHHETEQPAVWEELGKRDVGERERVAVGLVTENLLNYKTQRANEATLWARAIYPLLVLAERGTIRAWSQIPLSATFDEIEIRGEVDGALAASVDEDPELPYLVVVEAKRGVGATDPMIQLLAAMLCAARSNERGGGPVREIYGCYTIAAVWTFLRGQLDWSQPKPAMSVLSSREYWEKIEARTIVAVLESIVASMVDGIGGNGRS